jgi:hypothetical protein
VDIVHSTQLSTVNQIGPPVVPGGRPQHPSYAPPPRQSWWARLNPAPKVFLILAGVAVGLCLAPTVLIAAVSRLDSPAPAQRTESPRPTATRTTAKPPPTTAVKLEPPPIIPPAPAVTTQVQQPPPPPPAPEPEPEPDCHPSYSSPCVPIESDVDCAGGSGNGPAYVRGPVIVVGPDVYDLDRDGDGVGCE